jgi:hypothetical protein
MPTRFVAAMLLASCAVASYSLATPADALGGREIFRRYLETRPQAGIQHQRILSRDPGGNQQTTRSWLRFKEARSGEAPADGVVSKTLVHFTDPFDVRDTTVLVLWNRDGSAEQFIYRRLERKVRRLRMRSAGVMGTDFTIDDLGFRSIDQATYRRLPDEHVAGQRVYVVEASAKPEVHSSYRRGLFYIEQSRNVMLRARFFDAGSREVKELVTDPEQFDQVDRYWVPQRITARDLRGGTESTLLVESFVPAEDLPDALFSPFRLWYEPGSGYLMTGN